MGGMRDGQGLRCLVVKYVCLPGGWSSEGEQGSLGERENYRSEVLDKVRRLGWAGLRWEQRAEEMALFLASHMMRRIKKMSRLTLP